MTATNHVLTGALIGLTIHQPVLAVMLAIISHFLLDALPHYGAKNLKGHGFKLLLGADALLASFILLALVVGRPMGWQLAVGCGVAAASPDLMWLPGWLRMLHGRSRGRFNAIMKMHKEIQWAEKAKNYPFEIIWLVSGVILLVKLV